MCVFGLFHVSLHEIKSLLTMIESIRIKNFLSFKEEQEISFVATREKGQIPSESENWYTQIGTTKILKLLIFIGNNGAGKTNALAAIRYLCRMALHKCKDIEEKPNYEPFLLDDDSRNLPTEIRMVYHIDEDKYTYHISVCADCIMEESLTLHKGRNTASLYKRSVENGRTSISFGIANDLNIEDKKALLTNTLSNTSVLATFGSMNLSSELLRKNYLYFRNEMQFESEFDPMQLEVNAASLNNPIAKRIILSIIKHVDIKISDYEIVEHVFDIPKSVLEDAPKSWIEQMKRQNPDGKLHKWEIKFVHHTTHGDYPIDVAMESKGTVSMIHLIMLMYDMIINRRTTFIDEFSYSVHQISMDLMLRMFVALSNRSQIIITTQTVALLNSSRLRRDAIRICQKTEDGETKIKVIDQKKIHKNKNLYNAYLNNELEGLPFVEKDFPFDEFVQGIKKEISE
jgi:hypothetical protein